MKKRYIQLRYNGQTETIDEFDYNTQEERKEAHRCLNEYRILGGGYYYLSQRCTNDWKN